MLALRTSELYWSHVSITDLRSLLEPSKHYGPQITIGAIGERKGVTNLRTLLELLEREREEWQTSEHYWNYWREEWQTWEHYCNYWRQRSDRPQNTIGTIGERGVTDLRTLLELLEREEWQTSEHYWNYWRKRSDRPQNTIRTIGERRVTYLRTLLELLEREEWQTSEHYWNYWREGRSGA